MLDKIILPVKFGRNIFGQKTTHTKGGIPISNKSMMCERKWHRICAGWFDATMKPKDLGKCICFCHESKELLKK